MKRQFLISWVTTALVILIAGCSTNSSIDTITPENQRGPTESRISSVSQDKTSSPNLSTLPNVVSSIQVSTGRSAESTDLVNNGIAIRMKSLDSSGKSISLNNEKGIFSIYLYNSAGKYAYYNFGNHSVVSYFPLSDWNEIGWIPVDDFVMYYSVTGPLFRKFEGKVKLVLTLNKIKYEAENPVIIYLKGYEQISKEEYTNHEKLTGSPAPEDTPVIQVGNKSQFPEVRGTDVPLTPTFTWVQSSIYDDLYTYNFRLATDPDYKNIIDAKSGLPNIYTSEVTLESKTIYYYAIQELPIMPADFWVKNSFTTK